MDIEKIKGDNYRQYTTGREFGELLLTEVITRTEIINIKELDELTSKLSKSEREVFIQYKHVQENLINQMLIVSGQAEKLLKISERVSNWISEHITFSMFKGLPPQNKKRLTQYQKELLSLLPCNYSPLFYDTSDTNKKITAFLLDKFFSSKAPQKKAFLFLCCLSEPLQEVYISAYDKGQCTEIKRLLEKLKISKAAEKAKTEKAVELHGLQAAILQYIKPVSVDKICDEANEMFYTLRQIQAYDGVIWNYAKLYDFTNYMGYLEANTSYFERNLIIAKGFLALLTIFIREEHFCFGSWCIGGLPSFGATYQLQSQEKKLNSIITKLFQEYPTVPIALAVGFLGYEIKADIESGIFKQFQEYIEKILDFSRL